MGRVGYNLAHILLICCQPPGNTFSLTRGIPAFTATQLLKKSTSVRTIYPPYNAQSTKYIGSKKLALLYCTLYCMRLITFNLCWFSLEHSWIFFFFKRV